MVKQTIKASLRAEKTNASPRTHVRNYGKTDFHTILFNKGDTCYVSN